MFSTKDVKYEALPLPERDEMSDARMQAAADAFRDQMAQRHSIRDFSDRDVPADVIAACVQAAGLAPSGANHQPWHFVAIRDPDMKAQIRAAAEAEEVNFYGGGAGAEWLKALEPLGTGTDKPHLTIAPWLIVIFAQRYGVTAEGERYKNYYVPESVGIATGMLITALHLSGLSCLTHTPNPMKFLNGLCDRPDSEKPVMILAVGHPSPDATIPAAAKMKKPLDLILTIRGVE